MGCICSKGTNEDEIVAEVHSLKRDSVKSLRLLAATASNEPVLVVTFDDDVGHAAPDSAAADHGTPKPPPDVKGEEKAVAVAASDSSVQHHHTGSAMADARTSSRGGDDLDRNGSDAVAGGVPNGFSGEHAAAGWPSWLTSVAGEAIKGWLPRRADSFEKLDKIGQGTYSCVYRARDLETGKIVALKKVRFVNMDPESVRFMAREIHILRRLDHPNVIRLEGIVTSRVSCSLYLVFEYMDHDLAGLAATPGVKFTEPQIKCFMQQLLSGLDHCHSRRVLHRDIKGSNLLVGGDGVLKIGDLGLAALFDPDKKQPLTSRVVTLWYRPPELLLGATEYDVAVDLWSAGCILAELFAGKPIMPGRTEVEQLHKIFKLCGSPPEEYWKTSKLSNATLFKPQHPYPRRVAETFKDFPPSALALLDKLLAIEPEDRGTAASALQSDFFTTKPLACDPSSLPKFPPSKEYDAKLRDEETRRQREAALKAPGTEFGQRGTKDLKANPAQAGMGKQRQANSKCCSVRYNPMEDSGSGFPIDPPRSTVNREYHCAGSTMHPGAYGTSWNKGTRDGERGTIHGRSNSTVRALNVPELRTQRSYMPQAGYAGDMSNLSGLAAARNSTSSKYNRQDVSEPSEKQNALDRTTSSQKKDDKVGGKDTTMGYVNKNRRIHYSGPLMPPGGNMEDMLREHERQIQQAVRKARIDKATKRDF
ncbi:putative serine/threonine-protein kinase [Iris pallida]|uniref:[RNA-polymerase]-subunit kinase n=1 Tax=Iris pallida TaxID=29817 RepID=A0AAX6DMU1_IRIPA|nr:putative serine/threonine-protein kinase [Iris pallida]